MFSQYNLIRQCILHTKRQKEETKPSLFGRYENLYWITIKMVCIFRALFQSNGSSKHCTIYATFTHSHTLMTEATMQGTNSSIIWGSRTLQHASGGVRIRTGDLLITRRPVLPTELQPPATNANMFWLWQCISTDKAIHHIQHGTCCPPVMAPSH